MNFARHSLVTIGALCTALSAATAQVGRNQSGVIDPNVYVEGPGGRIWAQPPAGGGTTFVVTLPARPAVDAVAEPAAPSWPISPAGSEAAADA